MNKRVIIAVGATLTVAATPLTALATNASSQQADEHKITLCHANHSATGESGNQPYVRITVDYHAATQEHGHNGHTGPVAASLADAAAFKRAGVHWGDIIPPVPSQHYTGLNWDAKGKAVYGNQCQPIALATASPLGTVGQASGTTPAPATSTVTPPAVSELPKTGANSTLGTTLGLGLLTGILTASRAKLATALRRAL